MSNNGTEHDSANGRFARKYNAFDLTGDVGKLILPDGNIVLFSKDDYDLLNQFYWTNSGDGRVISQSGLYKKTQIARLLMDLEQSDGNQQDMVVDHINHDPFDNRRCNLRILTRQQNAINRSKKIRGIYYRAGRAKPWVANIRVNYQLIHLGHYATVDEAITARLAAEVEYFAPIMNEVVECQ